MESASTADKGRWVINHPRLGVYVGRKGSQSFWTLLDTAGQPAVTTFSTRIRAQSHIQTWTEAPRLQREVHLVSVPSGGPFDLATCGLAVGDLFDNLAAMVATDPGAARYAGGPNHLNA